LETVGCDAGSGDVLEAFQTASEELARHKTVPAVAEAALDIVECWMPLSESTAEQ
jgi:hypothetical protein